MAKNFPVYLDSDGNEVTAISGESQGTHGGSYNLSQGYIQMIIFLEKTMQSD